ncbi:TonB-dependent receptor [Roseateles asaccharophilus]|uniref:TonB-dependent receptor n=1 Tax=Roseateles asaccharophilus TaxID=582607 RepID=A0ABU2A244_9BURK|nr:TonB-dependent receptor [Roseateles asaccharophilus]MDR7331262.1 TonB-dependent receptor [Roseateles asaccharophilus]
MNTTPSRPNRRVRSTRLALGTALLAGLIAQAYAQTPAQPANPQQLDTVVVTGIRASLESSANAKKNAVGFIDAITAEDMGKFPDSNIAESIARIPGVTMTREITGEGLQIQIRGLGTNFTRILLNGAPVASASTGRTDTGSANREVDMDFLPGELFSRVSVIKSPTASILEGGAAGVVDMRSARPFDRKGFRTAFTLTGTKNEQADKYGNRGSALISNTWDNTFGVLAGVAWSSNKVKTTGFESIGWTNANLSATQGASLGAARNSTGGGNWTIPGTVPTGAGNGLNAGDTINEAFLLAKNPGLTTQQLDNAIIPRLGRAMVAEGSRDRQNAILSLEARPNASTKYFLDLIYGHKKNEFERVDMNWVGRNGSSIPLNMTVDKTDCANGCTVTKGTFANSQYFLEYRPYTEETKFHSVNPGINLKLSDTVSLDVQANFTKSNFHRQSPTVLFQTVLGSGLTTEYDNTSGVPKLTAVSADGNKNLLNTPSAFGWNGGRLNQQDELREIRTSGLRASMDVDTGIFDVKFGGAHDSVARRIRTLDNSGYWENIACRRNVNVFLPGPNTVNPGACNGAGAAGAAASTYPGYGTGFTAGANPAALQFLGSTIPNSAVPGYLRPTSNGFVTLDWARFAKDSGYQQARDAALYGTANSNNNVAPGFFQEKVTSVFAEVNGDTTVFGNQLRYNAGARYATTEQTFASLTLPADPRNASQNLADGGRYPAVLTESLTTTSYGNFLPSASVAYNLRSNLLARASMSKTITRADPTQLRALALSFTDPAAQNGQLTNPDLKPYKSDNMDLGLEWYTGREGYIALAWFQKGIQGFTANRTLNLTFADLNTYGVNWTQGGLTDTQKQGLYTRAGLPVPTDLAALPTASQLAAINALGVTLTQTQNTSDELKIKGLEFTVQQPLDQLTSYLKGFGVSANYTKVKQSGANVATGVPPYTYNLAAYYEGRFGGFRVTKTFTKGSQSTGTGQNGITAAAFFGLDYDQVDFTSRVNLGEILGSTLGWKKDLQMTFDVFNVTRSSQRTNFQFANAPYAIYEPGRTYQVGLRASF